MQRLRAMGVRATVMFFGSAGSRDFAAHREAVTKAQARLAKAQDIEETTSATAAISRLVSAQLPTGSPSTLPRRSVRVRVAAGVDQVDVRADGENPRACAQNHRVRRARRRSPSRGALGRGARRPPQAHAAGGEPGRILSRCGRAHQPAGEANQVRRPRRRRRLALHQLQAALERRRECRARWHRLADETRDQPGQPEDSACLRVHGWRPGIHGGGQSRGGRRAGRQVDWHGHHAPLRGWPQPLCHSGGRARAPRTVRA